MKTRKISVLTLLIIFFASVIALAFTSTAYVAAADEGRYIDFYSLNIFTTSATDGANISSSRIGEGETSEDYILFEMAKESHTVTYRKNLAYKWYAPDEETGEGTLGRLSMEIGFTELGFERYIIQFQSQEFDRTSKAVSTNYVIFVPNADKTGVYVDVCRDSEAEISTDGTLFSKERIKLSFGNYDDGDYTVTITDGSAEEDYVFENVSENYAEYVSSGNSAATPLTFSAVFEKDEDDEKVDEDATAGMIFYNLNGQSFRLYNVELGDDGEFIGGSVIDDAAAVLCLDENVNYFEFGGDVSFGFTAIDVITSSPRTTVNYYMLTYEQYNSNSIDYECYTDDEDSGAKNLFKEVETSSTVRLVNDDNTFIPSKYLGENGVDKFYGFLKVYVTVTDYTGTNGVTQAVFLDWYVSDEYKENIYATDLKNDADKECYFIKVIKDDTGAVYGQTEYDSIDDYKAYIARIQDEYQAKLEQAIADIENENGENGVVYAGSTNYLYLPSYKGASDFIFDDFGGYTDLKYSIYFRMGSESSNTNLSSAQLTINVSKWESYEFTIIATDAAGNAMRYPVEQDGKVVYEEIDTSEIWDLVAEGLLPKFTFTTEYIAATAEIPEEQSIGYVGTQYTGVSFTIKGASDSYDAEYFLYVFDRDAYYRETGVSLSYSEFISLINVKTENGDGTVTYSNQLLDNPETAKYFKEVYMSDASGAPTQDDSDYKSNLAYGWDSGTRRFTPQSANDFYVVELKLTDRMSRVETSTYMAIRASARANALKGEDHWLENNVASIVLLSIAGVALIGLIVLLVIKPKDKGDIDAVALKEKNKKAKKAAKKNGLAN